MHDLAHVCFSGAEIPPPPIRPRFVPAPTAVYSSERSCPDETAELEPFLAWLLARAGVSPAAFRPRPLHRQLPRLFRAARVADADEARVFLERHPERIPDALNRVLIGVSAFFRDGPVFAEIRDRVLPELLARRERPRIYSAGAADGQELLSIAMLLAERGALARGDLLGVDCRPLAIARAQSGRYPAAALDSLDPALREKYFAAQGDEWAVCRHLRSAVRWHVADLLTFQETTPWDLVLFRNVAIYLRSEHLRAAWEILLRKLAPGGYIVTTPAERPPAGLSLHRVSPAVYRNPI